MQSQTASIYLATLARMIYTTHTTGAVTLAAPAQEPLVGGPQLHTLGTAARPPHAHIGDFIHLPVPCGASPEKLGVGGWTCPPIGSAICRTPPLDHASSVTGTGDHRSRGDAR